MSVLSDAGGLLLQQPGGQFDALLAGEPVEAANLAAAVRPGGFDEPFAEPFLHIFRAA